MSIETLFEGQELSEEFKTKVSTVFEAAVIEAVAQKEKELLEAKDAEVVALTEAAEAKEKELQEAAEAATAALVTAHESEIKEASEAYETAIDAYIEEHVVGKVETFLDYVAEKWIEENRLAVETGLKVELTESFLTGMQTLFKEHYVEVPEEKLDVVAEMNGRISDLEGRLNETIAENVSMKDTMRQKVKTELVAEMCEGLADTQAERLASIAEGMTFADIESFKAKLEVVRETMVVEGTRVQEPEKETVIEPLNENSNEMGSLIAELTRLASKK